jgi:GntR family transcriptional repressor for pyruvate dehydrogenase complex
MIFLEMKPIKRTRLPTGKRPRRRRKNPPTDGRCRIPPLTRVNLVEETVRRIETQVLSGAMAPGDALPPEGQLSRILGVSRTVVREAMRTLGARGLIEVSQGRLARVKPADPCDVVKALGTFFQRGKISLLKLVEVRRPLESEIAALAAQRATPEQIDRMAQANDRLASAASLKGKVSADVCFHDLLAEATGNPVFSLLLRTLSDLMSRSRRETLVRTGKERALRGHVAILDAVRRADPEAARRAMLEHLAYAEVDLRTEKP